MLLLNYKIILFTFISSASLSHGEQQLSPNEFLQYFSTAAGINSLIFSLTNTIYSIKRFNQLKKKNKNFNEEISDSIIRSKELKFRNKMINNKASSLINIEVSRLSNEELSRNNNITQLIIQLDQLKNIEMVKDGSMIDESSIANSEQKILKNTTENIDYLFFHSNNSDIENINNTHFQKVDYNNFITRKFRGLVVE